MADQIRKSNNTNTGGRTNQIKSNGAPGKKNQIKSNQIPAQTNQMKPNTSTDKSNQIEAAHLVVPLPRCLRQQGKGVALGGYALLFGRNEVR